MKPKALLKEENLLTLFSQNNFIIPEIQREYVWGKHPAVVNGFLNELKNKIGKICASCHQPEEDNKINIGFLYSYKPDYVKVSQDRFLDENLIDGQQRITTLFLLLFYCALKEKKKQDFLALIRYEEMLEMGFTFKVREVTKRFLLELVHKVSGHEDLAALTNQTWFLSDYKNDSSISAMCDTLKCIHEIFSETAHYYFHLLFKVVFWHFKTEATSQGEELYITMNARGQDLSTNEIVKAATLTKTAEVKESGKKWEEWQQFFWKHRLDKTSENQSADQGYNGFLHLIGGLERYLRTPDNKTPTAKQALNEYLDMATIERYVNGLRYIEDNKEGFKEKYAYSAWVDKAISLLWGDKIIHSPTDWFIDYKDDNKGTERRRMAFAWSLLHYITTRDQGKSLGEDNAIDHVFRYFRILYVRYHNNDRAVTTIKEKITQVLRSSPWQEECLSKGEEKHKYAFIQQANDEEQRKIEAVIWELEDHPLNLDGENLRNLNSAHLVDYEQPITLEKLTCIKEAFYQLFPYLEGSEKPHFENKKLQTLLLFYGKYWDEHKAAYYWRYDFSEWKRIIRGIRTVGGKHRDESIEAFKSFFTELLESDVETLYDEKVKGFDVDFNTDDQLLMFRWYAAQLKEEMWSQGNKIAFGHFTYPEVDKNFPKMGTLVNIKTNFKGHTPQVLSELLEGFA